MLKKIICCLSVIVILIPMFCVPVSAADSVSDAVGDLTGGVGDLSDSAKKNYYSPVTDDLLLGFGEMVDASTNQFVSKGDLIGVDWFNSTDNNGCVFNVPDEYLYDDGTINFIKILAANAIGYVKSTDYSWGEELRKKQDCSEFIDKVYTDSSCSISKPYIYVCDFRDSFLGSTDSGVRYKTCLYAFDLSSDYIRFLFTMLRANKNLKNDTKYYYSMFSFNYYVSAYGDNGYNGTKRIVTHSGKDYYDNIDECYTLLSDKPIPFYSSGDIGSTSERSSFKSNVYMSSFSFSHRIACDEDNENVDFYLQGTYYSNNFTFRDSGSLYWVNNSINKFSFIGYDGSGSYPTNSSDYYYCKYKKIDFKFQSLYCNFDIDLSYFKDISNDNDTVHNKFNNQFFDSSYQSDLNVAVQVTPEFKLHMDRSINGNVLGGVSEDYFALEVFNNEDFAIQFTCYVVAQNTQFIRQSSDDPDFWNECSKDYPMVLNRNGFIPTVTGTSSSVWCMEKNQWIYSRETENQSDYYSDQSYLVNKPSTCFYVAPGESYRQIIKWSQLNLVKEQPYYFIVAAAECPYDKASDVHVSIASDDYSASQKFIPVEGYFLCYSQLFSVSNPLPYDSTETYGRLIPNTGGSQISTDYWKMNAIEKNGETEIRNANYSNTWRFDLDDASASGNNPEPLFNLDDISLDNVKGLVKDTTGYLSVIATVLSMLPGWVWVLLFAGISGLVVIGIFKALK